MFLRNLKWNTFYLGLHYIVTMYQDDFVGFSSACSRRTCIYAVYQLLLESRNWSNTRFM